MADKAYIFVKRQHMDFLLILDASLEVRSVGYTVKGEGNKSGTREARRSLWCDGFDSPRG